MRVIDYSDLVQAINRVNGWREGMIDSPLVAQLAQSLQVYKGRGEFNGTVDSALECLIQAEYEVQHLQRSQTNETD